MMSVALYVYYSITSYVSFSSLLLYFLTCLSRIPLYSSAPSSSYLRISVPVSCSFIHLLLTFHYFPVYLSFSLPTCPCINTFFFASYPPNMLFLVLTIPSPPTFNITSFPLLNISYTFSSSSYSFFRCFPSSYTTDSNLQPKWRTNQQPHLGNTTDKYLWND